MKNKIYKISNGKCTEIKGLELESHKKSVAICVDKFEEIKSKKIEELTEKTKKIFYDKYPIHKQYNIAIYGTTKEREEFKKFHNIEVDKYDKLIDNINSCINLKQLNFFKL